MSQYPKDSPFNFTDGFELLKELSNSKNTLYDAPEGSSIVQWAVKEIKALREKFNDH